MHYLRDRYLVEASAVNIIDDRWIDGVRKGWKTLLAQARREKTFAGALSQVQNLMRWCDLLKEDLLFNKGFFRLYDFDIKHVMQGGVEVPKAVPANKAVKDSVYYKATELLVAAEKKLYDLTSRIRYQLAMQTGNYENTMHTTSDLAAREDWEKRVIPRYGSWEKWAEVAVKEMLDRDLKEVDSLVSGKMFRAIVSKLDLKKGYEIETVYAEREIAIGKMKVVYQDTASGPGAAGLAPIELHADDIRLARSPYKGKDYISYLIKAQRMLEQKRLGFLWYGTLFVQAESAAGAIQYKGHEGKKAFADYNPAKDDVRLYGDPAPFVTDAIIHELGHRYFYRYMNQAERIRFADQFGDIPAVSAYGATHAVEDFAEVFEYYVMNRELTRDQLERLKSYFSGRKIREQEVERLKRRLSELTTTVNMGGSLPYYMMLQRRSAKKRNKQTESALAAHKGHAHDE